jgi:TRAP-type C4-dicarboxylate transport system permease small subunit
MGLLIALWLSLAEDKFKGGHLQHIFIISGSLVVALFMDKEQQFDGVQWMDSIHEWVYEQYWLNAYLPIVLAFSLEYLVSNEVRREQEKIDARIYCSVASLALLGFIWYLEEADESIDLLDIDSTFCAKILYIGSALVAIMEIILSFIVKRNLIELMTALVFTILKPLMLLGGVDS